MKNFLSLLASIVFLASCSPGSKIKKPSFVSNPNDDSDVLRPPEGYGVNKRSAQFVDSLETLLLAAGRNTQCVNVTGATKTGETANTASFKWDAANVNSTYVYKSDGYVTAPNVFVGSTSGTTYTVNGLLPGHRYFFRFAHKVRNKLCAMTEPIEVNTPSLPEPPQPPGGTGASVVYLDCDGGVLSGTSWNVSGPIVLKPSGLIEDERIAVLNRVKNDYREHTWLNFTLDSNEFNAANPNNRQKIYLTASYEWYSCGSGWTEGQTCTPTAGGVSFRNSFIAGNLPSFVFTAPLNYNVVNIATATSHEGGHGFDLGHGINVCGEKYGLSFIGTDGLRHCKIMGGGYGDYDHFFQTIIRCQTLGTTCMEAVTCAEVNEDAKIDSKKAK